MYVELVCTWALQIHALSWSKIQTQPVPTETIHETANKQPNFTDFQVAMLMCFVIPTRLKSAQFGRGCFGVVGGFFFLCSPIDYNKTFIMEPKTVYVPATGSTTKGKLRCLQSLIKRRKMVFERRRTVFN